MSSTLARRIRRVDVLPTTYRTSEEQRLVRNKETGAEEAVTVKIQHPERHRQELSSEEREKRIAELRLLYAMRRRSFYTTRHNAHTAHKARTRSTMRKYVKKSNPQK